MVKVRKFNNKSNIAGSYINKIRESKNITKEELCQKMQLLGINMDRVHLYRLEKGLVIIKDFELIAICNILNIDINVLKNLL